MSERQDDIDKTIERIKQPQRPFMWSDFKTTAEVERYQAKEHYSYPSIAPDSCMVAAIGTTYAPGAWERVVNMVQHTRDQGYNVWLDEMADPLCTAPYAAMGFQRNTAIMLAQARGFEWICFVENDALPEPELLINLLQRDIPIIAPRVLDPDHEGETIGYPDWPANEGLFPMKFVPSTFMLFRTAVFNCIPQAFVGLTQEGELFLRLWNVGHRMFQDTDNPLVIASAPTYRHNSEQERLDFLLEADKRRRQPPDRRPIDPQTETIQEIYAPFFTNGVVREEVK